MKFNDIWEYSETSPTGLRWKINLGVRARIGDPAGSFNFKEGKPQWVEVKYNGKKYRGHRIVWELVNSKIPEGMVIDHIDRNPFNNNISNLRVVTKVTNSQNRSKSKNNSSGYTGTSFVVINDNTYAMSNKRVCGKTVTKYFSVRDLGLLPSFSCALLWRTGKIDELNRAGANYTENHGI